MKIRWTVGLMALVLALVLSCTGEKVKVGSDSVDASSNDTVEVMSSETVEASPEWDCAALCAELDMNCGWWEDDCNCGKCEPGAECLVSDVGATFCFDFEAECPAMCESRGANCGGVVIVISMEMPECLCGDCAGNETCVEIDMGFGYCCTPDCNGKNCGDDGCEGSCGVCVEGYCEDGVCLHFDPDCETACSQAECGVVVRRFDDGPDYECECGECPADPCFDLCVNGMCQPSGADPEVCDGKDNNCNGQVDEGCPCDTDCDDDNLCTDDTCDPMTGCQHAPTPEEPGCCLADADCDDENPYTLEFCIDYQCTLDPPGPCGTCDDDDLCTSDSCDLFAGECKHEKIASCCNEDADCAADGYTDGNPCTDDTCDSLLHMCEFASNDNNECDDDDPETVNICLDGECVISPP